MPSRLCQKEKEQNHQSRSQDREEGESQDEREQYFGQKEKGHSGSTEKSQLHNEERPVPWMEGRESKEILSRSSRKKHEQMGGPKAFQEDLESLVLF